jgi:hypothetical protein
LMLLRLAFGFILSRPEWTAVVASEKRKGKMHSRCASLTRWCTPGELACVKSPIAAFN